MVGKAGDNQYTVGDNITDLKREAMVGPHGGDRTSKTDNISLVLTSLHCHEVQKDRSSRLARLKREAPALFGKVVAGEMSANAGLAR